MSNYNNLLIITIFCIHFLLKIYLSNYQPSEDVGKQYLGSSWQLLVLESVQCSACKRFHQLDIYFDFLIAAQVHSFEQLLWKGMYNKHFYTCFKYVGFVGVSLAIWQREEWLTGRERSGLLVERKCLESLHVLLMQFQVPSLFVIHREEIIDSCSYFVPLDP